MDLILLFSSPCDCSKYYSHRSQRRPQVRSSNIALLITSSYMCTFWIVKWKLKTGQSEQRSKVFMFSLENKAKSPIQPFKVPFRVRHGSLATILRVFTFGLICSGRRSHTFAALMFFLYCINLQMAPCCSQPPASAAGPGKAPFGSTKVP